MLDNPAVNGIVANSRDITAKIENQLKNSWKCYLIMKDAILITDAEPSEGIGHKIIYVNEALQKWRVMMQKK
jgi:hypothetical protein